MEIRTAINLVENAANTSIPSEALNPFGAMIIGRLFARCEAAKGDKHKFEDACANLWMALLGLQRVAAGVSTATHFTIAVGNHQRQVATYIQDNLGIDPMTAWKW